MIYNLVNEVLSLLDKSSLEIQTYFESINFRVFDPIFKKYNSTTHEAAYIVCFIILAYSEESNWLIKDADTLLEKEAILERLQVPEFLRNTLIDLYDENDVISVEKNVILNVVTDYLDYFPSSDFKRLKQIQNSITVLQDMIDRKDFTDDKQVFSSTQFLSAIRNIDTLYKMESKLKVEMRTKNKTKYSNLEAEMKSSGKKINNKIRSPQVEYLITNTDGSINKN